MENVLETYLGGVQDGVAAVMSNSLVAASASSEPDDIPRTTNEPVWILGKRYCAIQGKQHFFRRHPLQLFISMFTCI